MFKPCIYKTEKQKSNAWMNAIYHSHDMLCGCDDPGKHLITTILKTDKWINLTDDQRKIATECLLTEDGTTGAKDETDGDLGIDMLLDNELEKLFSEENDVPEITG